MPPDTCPTCTKPAAQVDELRDVGGWECAHVDCPTRRRCWSEGVRAPKAEAVLPLDAGLDRLFDNVMALGMPGVSAAGAGA